MTNLFFALAVVVSTGVETWPSFLGPPSASVQPAALPLNWNPKQGLQWTVAIPGHGQSSPVVWDDKVFVTSVEGPLKDTYHVTCFNTESGIKAWTYSFPNSVPVSNSYYVSRAAPTPVVDAERIVAFFESGDCLALSHDGSLLWQRKLAEDEGPFVAEFGLGASPCQSTDSVFLLLEHDGPSCLMSLNKSNGETRWKVNRKSTRSWSSPAMVQVAGRPQIVVSSGGEVQGYELQAGQELWSLDDIGGNTGCTPIDCGQGRFLVGASPGRNGEDAGSAAKSNCLVQVRPDGDGFVASKLWIAKGAFPSWASPIMHKGLAYWINRSGVVYCFDATNGEAVYTERTKQSCWATPFAIDDRVYLFGKDGLTTILKAGPTFEIIAENETWLAADLPTEAALPEETSEERRAGAAMFSRPTLYGYAVTSTAFFVRVGNALICLRR